MPRQNSSATAPREEYSVLDPPALYKHIIYLFIIKIVQ